MDAIINELIKKLDDKEAECQYELESFTSDDTFKLGEMIGKAANAGLVITLTGDLGVGKTVFAKGIASGLNIQEDISSPTFTIVQVYDDGRLPLYHFDVYRIEDEDEMYEVGYEDYFYGDGVSLIEWADQIRDLIPSNHLRVVIEKNLDKGFDYRRISINKMA